MFYTIFYVMSSSNDYTLNSLLTLLPKKIYIHIIDCYVAKDLVDTNRSTICNYNSITLCLSTVLLGKLIAKDGVWQCV